MNNNSFCSSCLPTLTNCTNCSSNVSISNKTLFTGNMSMIEHHNSPKFIPSSELEVSLDDSNKLGRGGFGTVYSAKWLGSPVAVKVVDSSSTVATRLRQEAALMASINHPLVIRLFGICEFDNKLGIVMEKADGILPVPSKLNQKTLQYAIDIVSAVKLLHSKNIIHGDLKPENILLVNGKIKLTDFGSARTCSTTSSDVSTILTTPKYAPIESFDGIHSYKGDVYSIGLILYELLCDKLAFKGLMLNSLLMKKFEDYVPNFDAKVSPQLKEIITRCVASKPEERPDFVEIKDFLDELLVSTPKDHFERYKVVYILLGIGLFVFLIYAAFVVWSDILFRLS
ncbi:hypothetical protein RCL1_000284 [Eukaryota sp. TZLM3-RCL]